MGETTKCEHAKLSLVCEYGPEDNPHVIMACVECGMLEADVLREKLSAAERERDEAVEVRDRWRADYEEKCRSYAATYEAWQQTKNELRASDARLAAMAEVPCTKEWPKLGLDKALACAPEDPCSFCRVRAMKETA